MGPFTAAMVNLMYFLVLMLIIVGLAACGVSFGAFCVGASFGLIAFCTITAYSGPRDLE